MCAALRQNLAFLESAPRHVQMFAPMFALYKLYSPLEVEQSYWDALSSFMSGILGTFLLFFFENI